MSVIVRTRRTVSERVRKSASVRRVCINSFIISRSLKITWGTIDN